MAYTTLISADDLARQLGQSDLCVIDCRFNLNEVTAGQASYDEGHIPGAVYAHLDNDLAGKKTGVNGRHPLPDRESLAARLREWGVNRDSQLVAYDAQGGAMASRLWWLLRWLGHDKVAVLDGGWKAWCESGGQLTTDVPDRQPGDFTAGDILSPAVPVEELQQLLVEHTVSLIDARDPGRFRGEQEPLDPVAGHVPGATNHFFMRNLDESGRFLPPEALRKLWTPYLEDNSAASVVHMCGSGVTACHNLLAMQHAGLSGARLYVGSWSEWCSDPDRPVATGDED
ncbi:MAG: sulfurtransferase [Granulosicoccaceae bacterium]|jgi:thiosulfate/3-mercaptopyruvate sulfurtransferase